MTNTGRLPSHPTDSSSAGNTASLRRSTPRTPTRSRSSRALLAELLPNFTSERIHVGLDEPWELPADAIDDYLVWLGALRALPELAGKEMLVWGDILASRPEIIARVPAGVTVCEWGYDASTPFAARAAVLAAQQQPFWTCPGTSSWLSILGRVTNMRENCTNAADAAVRFGGGGMLNTDWGDMGHLQYLPISEPGLAFGAATAWCLETNRDLDLAAALSRHCYDDPANEIGPALVELGDIHRIPSVQLDNVASMVLHLYYPQLDFDRGPLQGFTVDEFEAVLGALDAVDARVARSTMQRADADLVRAELANGMALMRVLARDAIARLRANSSLASIPEIDATRARVGARPGDRRAPDAVARPEPARRLRRQRTLAHAPPRLLHDRTRRPELARATGVSSGTSCPQSRRFELGAFPTTNRREFGARRAPSHAGSGFGADVHSARGASASATRAVDVLVARPRRPGCARPAVRRAPRRAGA